MEIGDDTTHPITQIGKVPLSMQDGQTKYLKDVFHVPTITKNMVLVGQMVEQGLQVTFNCRNPSFGFATKARGCKVASQVGDPGALHMLPGVQRV